MGAWIVFLPPPLAGILSLWARNLGEVVRLPGILSLWVRGLWEVIRLGRLFRLAYSVHLASLLPLLLELLPGRASSYLRLRPSLELQVPTFEH